MIIMINLISEQIQANRTRQTKLWLVMNDWNACSAFVMRDPLDLLIRPKRKQMTAAHFDINLIETLHTVLGLFIGWFIDVIGLDFNRFTPGLWNENLLYCLLCFEVIPSWTVLILFFCYCFFNLPICVVTKSHSEYRSLSNVL